MNRVVIGVGSNIEPESNIPAARDRVRARFRLLAESAFITTTPLGTVDQPDFRNGAWLIETELDAPALKEMLTGIETDLGRIRTDDPNAPRTIDLDIVIWNDEVTDTDYYERDFLRDAVHEVLPGLSGST